MSQDTILLKDLRDYYDRIVSETRREGRILTRMEICHIIAQSPAPRIYVTPDYATRIVKSISQKKAFAQGSYRKKKHEELYRRYMSLPPEKRNKNGIRTIIEEPANSFFLSPYRINILLYKSLRLQ